MQEKFLEKNFKKAFITILAVFIAVLAVAGAAIPLSLRTQISEGSVLRAQARQEYEAERAAGTLPAGMDWDHFEDAYSEQWEDQLTPLSTANYVLIFGLSALALAVVLWYWITVVQWLEKSAYLADMDVHRWTVLGACFNFIAVIVFLAVRGRKRRISRGGEAPQEC